MRVIVKDDRGDTIRSFRTDKPGDTVIWQCSIDELALRPERPYRWTWTVKDQDGKPVYASGKRFKKWNKRNGPDVEMLEHIRRDMHRVIGDARHFHPLACDCDEITDEQLAEWLKGKTINAFLRLLSPGERYGLQKFLDMVAGIRPLLGGAKTWDIHRHLVYNLFAGNVTRPPKGMRIQVKED